MGDLLKLILDKRRVKKDGTYPICLQLYFAGSKSYINLSYSVHVDFWNQEFGKITRGAKMKNIGYANDNIAERLAGGEKLINKYQSLGLLNTMKHEELKKAIQCNSSALVTFTGYLDSIIESYRQSGNTGQAKIYTGAKNFLAKYVDKEKVFEFDDINFTLLLQLERDFKPLFEGNKNGLAVYLRTIRAVWNRAIKEHVASAEKYPFKHYSIKSSKTHKTAIASEDMRKIADLPLEKDSVSLHCRNLFFFSFYTRGMNFFDIAHLKKSNIKNGRIDYVRSKTKKMQSIRINDNIKKILDEYLEKSKTAYIFPIITNNIGIDIQVEKYHSEANHALKRWAKRLKINETLSFNTARHSWATIAKHKNVSVAIISEGLGHTDEKTTQIYLDDFDQSVIDDANDLVVF